MKNKDMRLIAKYGFHYYAIYRDKYHAYFRLLDPDMKDEFLSIFSEYWYVTQCYFVGYDVSAWDDNQPKWDKEKYLHWEIDEREHMSIDYDDIETVGPDFITNTSINVPYRIQLLKSPRPPMEYSTFWITDIKILY